MFLGNRTWYNKLKMNKKVQIVVFILFTVLAVQTFRYIKKYSVPKTPAIEQTKSLNVTLTEVSKTTVPERFPANFPLEKGADVRSNYTAQTANSFQSSRAFSSKKTVAENYFLYSAFLKKDGWKILSSIDHPDSKFLYAQKGPHEFVTIAIDKVTTDGKTTVEVSASFVYR